MNDEERIKKAAMFIDSFLVRTNTNLKKYSTSKDLPDNESVIEILESQKRVLEKIKEILTSN
jgi:tryptophanyl-tRNA synthetase